MIYLTDTYGAKGRVAQQMTEPEPGSVVLTEGAHGTAWQRHFSDGLWHCTLRARAKTWDEILSKRNVTLVYNAGVRDQKVGV